MGNRINFPQGRKRRKGLLSDEETLLVPFGDTTGTENKPSLLQSVTHPPKIGLNAILMATTCILVLVLLGFIGIEIPSPLVLLQAKDGVVNLRETSPNDWIQYSLQVPFAVFMGALLGPALGGLSLLTFLLAGLFILPLFAGGGGIAYVLEPGFGYLAGMTVGAVIAGRMFPKAFKVKNIFIRRSLKLFLVASLSILTIHLAGLLGIIINVATGGLSLSEAGNWLLRLSVEPLPYDMLMAGIFLCVVRQLRLCLWLVLY